jgi:hypothetical protein
MPGHNHSVGNAIADALAKYGAKMWKANGKIDLTIDFSISNQIK